ncbi:MAG TPA: nucleotidyltransferase family protein [Gammaproteobacteria bacterium]|nr:nucleotidyltransferase family protein [Gammaproteobacteria bacterium]
MKAMVLAAGRGERMGALTADRPKPLLEIGGGSLIERHLQRLAACGVDEVVVNLSYRGAQIRERLGRGERFGVAIRYSDEGEPPLETAGGIVRALPLLGAAPFLLVNADVFTDFDFGELASDARSALVLVPNPAHNARGDFGSDEAGLVRAAPPLSTYGGIAVLDPKLFAGLADGRRPLKPVLDGAIARRELRAVHYGGLWLDVGTPERLDEARRIVAARS